MSAEFWAAVIGGVAGLATGTLSSLIGPWVNWRIEQKREERQHRRNLISSWRAGISAIDTAGTDVEGMPNDYQVHFTSRFFDMPWYETLRPRLPEDLRATERNRAALAGGMPRTLKNALAAEVDRIEEEWGLRP
ncbi:hypothetical protein [Mycobacteroides abscessus]|uniref:hypothetical protein n=1 Tax=Mycobacteroides abscessus TaxID=36809 RepID=UPI0009A818F3|nr:hypothetical protein [Mycobacteroides abscessus]MDM3948478.1 hypothetical protein [Mycobacteroides abscessus]SLI45753.1 Uncharacterised protein [Mycobacteroides abscessus subsp. massiliense]